MKKTSGCVCNQENQIINIRDGKSTICPNLLIDNYDVVSNHSAYIGKFSDDKLFYLMSRGISLKDAYKLLLNGFLINSKSLDLEKVGLFLEEIDKIYEDAIKLRENTPYSFRIFANLLEIF